MWVRVLVQEFKIPQVAVFFGMAKKKKKLFTLTTGGLLSSGKSRAVVAVRWWLPKPLDVSQ